MEEFIINLLVNIKNKAKKSETDDIKIDVVVDTTTKNSLTEMVIVKIGGEMFSKDILKLLVDFKTQYIEISYNNDRVFDKSYRSYEENKLSELKDLIEIIVDNTFEDISSAITTSYILENVRKFDNIGEVHSKVHKRVRNEKLNSIIKNIED